MIKIHTLNLTTPALFDFLKAAKVMTAIEQIEYFPQGDLVKSVHEQVWIVNITPAGEVNFPLLLTLAYMTDLKAMIEESVSYQNFVLELKFATVLKFVIKGTKTECESVAPNGEKYNFAL